MKTLLGYIKEDIFDLNKEIFKFEDGYEVFSGIIMHIEDKYKISLHLTQEKVYLNGDEWISLLYMLKSKKIKHIQLITDLSGYHEGSGLYLNLDDCNELDGLKIHVRAKTSLYLIKRKGKCVVKNFYINRDNDSYYSLVFDIKNSDSLSFEDCLLYAYYAECSVEKLPNIKNTETDFGQLRIITSKNIMDKYKYLSKTGITNLVEHNILNNWKLFDLGSIQVFFNKIKGHADAMFYKTGQRWIYNEM